MLEVGNLYTCEVYHLLFYPDPDTAAYAAKDHACTSGAYAASIAALWSNQLGKPVLFLDKNIPLLVIQNKEEYVEVLAGDKKGWIIYEDGLEIKELP